MSSVAVHLPPAAPCRCFLVANMRAYSCKIAALDIEAAAAAFIRQCARACHVHDLIDDHVARFASQSDSQDRHCGVRRLRSADCRRKVLLVRQGTSVHITEHTFGSNLALKPLKTFSNPNNNNRPLLKPDTGTDLQRNTPLAVTRTLTSRFPHFFWTRAGWHGCCRSSML